MQETALKIVPPSIQILSNELSRIKTVKSKILEQIESDDDYYSKFTREEREILDDISYRESVLYMEIMSYEREFGIPPNTMQISE